MFTWGSKYLFAVAGAGLLGAVLYGLISGGELLGVVSVGYRGGVGDHAGYALLLGVGVASAALGVLNVIVRDGDADEGARLVGVEGALAVRTPRAPSYWGPMGAFGLACLVVGAAVSQAFFILGLVVLTVVLLEWLVLAWSDRATGDQAVNSVIRDRVIGPIEVPLLALLGIAVIVMGISRVFLAVSEVGSVVVAAVVASLIFGTATSLAKSKAPRAVISGVVAVAAIAVLAGGILGAAVGERQIGHPETPGEGAGE